MRGLLACALMVMAVLPSGLRAQAPEARPSPVFQVNPLGFLQFGPTAEAEFAVGRGVALAFGARVPTLGLLSYAVDPDLGFTWTAAAAIRFFFDGERQPAGWWAGPRAELGRSNSSGETYTLKGGGLEFGHRWLRASGKNIAVGAMAGKFVSSSDLSGYFVMGVLNLGVGGR
jgi:hypothetical protein